MRPPPTNEELAAQITSLREICDARFNSAEKAVETAMSSAEKAVEKAERAAEKRFDAVNEFRQTLGDQQATFSRSDSTNIRFENIERQLENMNKSRAASSWGWLVAAVAVVLAAASFMMNN